MTDNAPYTIPQFNWKEQAKALFFIEHMCISDIAEIVQRKRETVSRFISRCDGYDDEMHFRKKQSIKARKAYQRQWDRDNRNYAHRITAESLRKEHETAVKILSSERF